MDTRLKRYGRFIGLIPVSTLLYRCKLHNTGVKDMIPVYMGLYRYNEVYTGIMGFTPA
jgi:hypothetical protein